MKTDVKIHSNEYKLDKLRFRREIGKNWLMIRVVDILNKLPGHVVDANTVENFKWRLEEFMDREGR